MSIITNWIPGGNANWNNAGAWDNGVPGVGYSARFPSNTGQCTVTASVTCDEIIMTYANTIIVNSGVVLATTGTVSVNGNFRILSGGKVSVGASAGGTLILDGSGLNAGEVDVTCDGTGFTFQGAPSPSLLSVLKLSGSGNFSIAGQFPIASLDPSGITGTFTIKKATVGQKFWIPGGQTLSMPSTPSWLSVVGIDSSLGGTITAHGGTDGGGNVSWDFSGISHSTSGILSGTPSSLDGVAKRKTFSMADIRTIEVFDERYQTDCTVVVETDPSSPVTSQSGFDNLTGKNVWLKGWDRFFGLIEVDSDGNITLPQPLWKFYVGLPFECIAETMPVPSAPLQNKKFSNIDVRVNKMRGLRINGSEVVFMKQGSEVDMPPTEFTGHKEVPNLGADKDATIKIVNELPYGGTILAIAGRLEIGES